LNGQGYNKGTQKGGPFDGDLLRADTAFMSNQSETDMSEAAQSRLTERATHHRKQRGRKNKVLHLIDSEDYQAGTFTNSGDEA
jgi:hypothetical protein